jgi:AhpD family alkylhydroperoxidase
MRQATVRLVDENAAGGNVREIFDDIKATKRIDFVPSFWRALATYPDQLELVWRQLKTLMHPEATRRKSNLDAKTREIIALAVSATNGCSYCVNSHTAALKKLGADNETVGEVLAIAGLLWIKDFRHRSSRSWFHARLSWKRDARK